LIGTLLIGTLEHRALTQHNSMTQQEMKCKQCASVYICLYFNELSTW